VPPAGRERPGATGGRPIGDDGGVEADVQAGHAAAAPPPAARRPSKTPRDMIISLGVVLLVIGALWAVAPRRHYDAVHQIDYTQALRDARGAAPYRVLAPEGLSPRWRATSVRYDGDVNGAAQWHLGFVSPENEYVGLEQSNGPARDFIFNLSNRGLADGSTVVAGESWDRYLRETRDVRSLARTENGVTTLVTGTASYEEMAEFAAALR
jgi:hypothetical protein